MRMRFQTATMGMGGGAENAQSMSTTGHITVMTFVINGLN